MMNKCGIQLCLKEGGEEVVQMKENQDINETNKGESIKEAV